MSEEENNSEIEWKKKLTKGQYQVLREKGTEKPFTGEYWNTHDKGMYYCSGCGAPLFDSDTKFDSASGWPSFYAPLKEGAISEKKDLSFGMKRTEIICSKCGSHLGHVFKDGPKPTGLRYCVNSISLKFNPEEEK